MPVRAGRFIVHGQHDRAKVPPNKLGIEIEAALAFGTGHHGTTRGCLLLLDQVLKAHRPRRVLDLGTGTGVLAIAAAKALQSHGAGQRHRSAVGAGRARERPAQWRRAIWSRRSRPPAFRRRNSRKRGPFDLVLANILANPLRQMATPMARHLAPSGAGDPVGAVAASGAGVIAAYRARGLVLERHIQIEGWSSLLMRKRGMKMTLPAEAG